MHVGGLSAAKQAVLPMIAICLQCAFGRHHCSLSEVWTSFWWCAQHLQFLVQFTFDALDHVI